MTKPLHAGWAAHNGVVAADLAARGLTADARTLEGENGFLRAMSGAAEFDPGVAVRGLGAPWEIVDPGIGVKLYPCCYATHRAVDAALEVRGEGGAIDDIEVVVSPGTLTPLINRLPDTGLEGKFSMEYVVAASVQDGRVNLSTFSDGAVARADVRALMGRVRVRDDGEPMQFPIGGVADVTIHANGQSRSARVEAPRGDPTNPLSWDDLAAKFRDCAGLALPPDRVERFRAMVENLDKLPDVRELMAAAG
jgi:2-methylcitrate dehydratase PrpD